MGVLQTISGYFKQLTGEIIGSQTLADGRAASGTYALTREDDNTISVQLIGHEIEGEPQPASDAVRVTRVTAIAPQETAPQKVQEPTTKGKK